LKENTRLRWGKRATISQPVLQEKLLSEGRGEKGFERPRLRAKKTHSYTVAIQGEGGLRRGDVVSYRRGEKRIPSNRRTIPGGKRSFAHERGCGGELPRKELAAAEKREGGTTLSRKEGGGELKDRKQTDTYWVGEAFHFL